MRYNLYNSKDSDCEILLAKKFFNSYYEVRKTT